MKSTRTLPLRQDPFALRETLFLDVRIKAGIRLRVGDALSLQRLPGRHDRLAILAPEQGEIGQTDSRFLHDFLAAGGHVTVSNTTRQPWLERWFSLGPAERTIVIAVEPQPFDWSRVDPVIRRNTDISDKITEADHLAKRQPERALALYQDAVNDILDLHFEFPEADFWRRVPYPINELSGLLERLGQIQPAHDAILAYEAFPDRLGLTLAERRDVLRRKRLLERKLMLTRGVASLRQAGRQALPPRLRTHGD